MSDKTKAQLKEKFADTTYPIQVIGRHISVTDAMKKYAIDKLAKIDHFHAKITDVVISMDVQKLVHTVDFLINIKHTRIKVSGHSDSMYTSIDQAIARLNTKLRRYHDKLHAHHAKSHSIVDMNVNVLHAIVPVDEINDQIEEETLKQIDDSLRPHPIIDREKKPLKTLSQEEAIMKMELAEHAFLIYRSEEDRKLKVIYRRTDGNYGVIEPE